MYFSLLRNLFIAFLFVFTACENKTSDALMPIPKEDKSRVYSKKQINELKTASKIAYTLPSPNEMAQLLYQTKAVYDVTILNDANKIDDYLNDLQQALALGVYFADLSFTSMFDYPQQAMMYMGAVHAMAEHLRIDGVFTDELMQRLENNLGEKDSLMQVVADAYAETDFILQDEDRAVLAKAVLAGAWLEGVYIATNLRLQENAELIIQKIADQKPAIKNLIKMLEDCESEQFDEIVAEIKLLAEAFEQVVEVTQNSTESDEKYAQIQRYTLSDADFKMIKKITLEIRAKLIMAEF